MISRLYPGLVVLIPTLALAQSGESPDAQPDIVQYWSLDELCGAREREDVRHELDRRDLFSARELRAIRDGEAKRGMSLDALICGMGQPATIVEGVAWAWVGPVAAYIYQPGEAEGLVAYVVETGAESTVVHVVESDDPQAIARNPNSRLACGGTSASIKCTFVDVPAYSLWPSAGQGRSPGSREGLPFPGGRCGERLCDANVQVPSSQAVLPLPRVPDDAQ